MHVKEIYVIFIHFDICSIFNADLSFSRNNFLFFSLNCRNNIYLTVQFTNKIHTPQLYIPWEGEGGYDENFK
jgi:hypothetical protein